MIVDYFSKFSIWLFLSLPTLVFTQDRDYTSYVNPFIGTDAHGHTFPGATVPFGMVQLSPDTRLDGWDGCSGYHFTDSIVYGFSHTHLSGTGVSDYGDILLMPMSRRPSSLENYSYASKFRKQTEVAKPGYYSVFLEDPKVKAELTASQRVGVHKYTYSNRDSCFMVLDMEHRDPVIEVSLKVVDDRTICGMRRSKAWAVDQVVYFWMEFSSPLQNYSVTSGTNTFEWKEEGYVGGEALRMLLHFTLDQDQTLIVKTGISAVDVEGARNNLKEEVGSKSFDEVRSNAVQQWNKELGKIDVSGGKEEDMITFYSALYHTMIAPNIWSDVDGRYRGIDKQIHQAGEYPQYSVFSLWDTYRTLHPLLTIIDRERTLAFIHSFLRIYQQGGLLPVWELAANETYCMIGYHSVSVILDAWRKGIRDFDAELALEAMVHSARQDHFGLDAYKKYGYIAGDKDHESVSKTLEYAYDDWCIAMFAKELGRADLYEEFIQRAQSYKHIFDPETKFMRPRINGGWKTPFAATDVDFHFTEANSWQYSFYVPQDLATLIDMHGGRDAFEEKLDELFGTEDPVTGRKQSDITGLIGQYAHGNEPSHHMAYLYNYIGKPWKTHERVKQILREQYSTQADGLSGNEDCGQMSAWFVMSAMGMYPVTPGSNIYNLSSPLFNQIIVKLENGQQIVISSMGASQSYDYIVSASINGRDLNRTWIDHNEIADGGRLSFILQPKPNKNWGSEEASIPASIIQDQLIVVTPYFSTPEQSFNERLSVSIYSRDSEDKILFRTNKGKGFTPWLEYTHPLELTETTTLEAKAVAADKRASFVVKGHYTLFQPKYSIDIKSKFQKQYDAGGPQALIDGIRGAADWKLGGWQGYQGQDFEAIIDLGKKKRIKQVGSGYFQDIRSWIWLPTQVTYYVSSNGVDFKELGTVENDHPIDDYEYSVKDFILRKKARARYVKVVAKNFGQIPTWHLGSGGASYLFIDEIWVD